MTDPLAPWEPSDGDTFDLRKVGHLLRRAAFSASLATRRSLQRAGVDAAIDHVAPASDHGLDAELPNVLAFDDAERVRAWRVWLAVRGAEPLRVRTSYFWHGHFATGNQKVGDARAMALQMELFDRAGLGTFDELLAGVCRDPAMLRWLDNDTNTRAQPNENFARELFELFALGRGHYTERDVREAARCFTGWHVRDGGFHLQRRLHDDGDKTVLGATGRFGGDDIVRLVVARPDCAEFLAAKWLRFFVHPEPEPAEIDALANCYVRNERRVGDTLKCLLRSRLFFSPRAFRAKVKSPADFVIGTVRCLGAQAAPATLAAAMSSMGETWLEPPSVEGWHGERAWLSPAAWLLRSNFVADLLARRRGNLRPGPSALLGDRKSPTDQARAALLLLLDGEAPVEAAQQLAEVARAHADAEDAAALVLHAAACLPEYQLA